MENFQTMSRQELLRERDHLAKQFAEFKAMGLSLNMARGKPSAEQLDLSMEMLDVVNSRSDCRAEDGADCRNYCDIYGIPEAIRLFPSTWMYRRMRSSSVASPPSNFCTTLSAGPCSRGSWDLKSPGGNMRTPSSSARYPGMTSTSDSATSWGWR